MSVQTATTQRTWVGWTVAAAFGAVLLHVGVTGTGLGAEPTPVDVQWGFLESGSNKVVLVADPPGSLAADLRRIGVLGADEVLLHDPGAAQNGCSEIVVGSGQTYRGRICVTEEGLYRLRRDGSDPGTRWTRVEGGWAVAIQTTEQLAG